MFLGTKIQKKSSELLRRKEKKIGIFRIISDRYFKLLVVRKLFKKI
jgi:ribosomal protein L4